MVKKSDFSKKQVGKSEYLVIRFVKRKRVETPGYFVVSVFN